jgi:aspartate/methionine/tyrosine aminotransferase
LMTKALRELPLAHSEPEGGFYIFPKLKDKKVDGQVFSEKLLVEKGVAVTPGTAFGDNYNQFVRLSICQPKDVLLEAVKRIKEMLS